MYVIWRLSLYSHITLSSRFKLKCPKGWLMVKNSSISIFKNLLLYPVILLDMQHGTCMCLRMMIDVKCRHIQGQSIIWWLHRCYHVETRCTDNTMKIQSDQRRKACSMMIASCLKTILNGWVCSMTTLENLMYNLLVKTCTYNKLFTKLTTLSSTI